MNDRHTREAAIVAELEAYRLIAQAKRVNQRIRIAVLAVVALLVGFNWPGGVL